MYRQQGSFDAINDVHESLQFNEALFAGEPNTNNLRGGKAAGTGGQALRVTKLTSTIKKMIGSSRAMILLN
jgi:hypothetical protein